MNGMKKSIWVSFILLIVLLFSYLFLFPKGKQEHLVLNIPMPQPGSAFSSEIAESEEFSTFIWNDTGHKYFIWRMHVSVSLGFDGFDSVEDVEMYYNKWFKRLGWEETSKQLCDSQMIEFRPGGSYRAYKFPSKYYVQPIACLIVWSEFEDGELLSIMIKTINPSQNVLSDWFL